MSWNGRITTTFDKESQLLLIVNFLSNNAAEGLRQARLYQTLGDRDQKAHADWFIERYRDQQTTKANQQLSSGNIGVPVHETNFRREYDKNVWKSSSYDIPSTDMRRQLHKMHCLSEAEKAIRSQGASTSTSSSRYYPIEPNFTVLAPHSEQGATSRRNRPDIRYIPMAQRRTQLQVQDLRTISFQSWRATAQQDKRDDLEANHQAVRVRIASMRLSDDSEEQDSGDEQDEEEDAVTGPSPEQDHPHSQSQPGPSTSQMTDAQHAVQEQL